MSVTVIAETVRRHVTSVGYIVFVMLLAVIGLLASGFATPAAMWPPLVGLLAIITGSAVVGPEFSTGTLQLIVSKPLRRSSYLLSRVAGVFVSVTLAATAGLAGEAAGRLLRDPASVPWQRLMTAFAGELAAALLAIALLTLLGSVTRAWFNVAIYIGVEAVLGTIEAVLGTIRVRGQAVGDYLEQHPGIERGLTTVSDVLFASAPAELTARWLTRIAITVVIALLLACIAFERREVPYGSD